MIARILGILFQPIAALIAIALGLAVVLAGAAALWTWGTSQISGLPMGGVALFGIAIVAAVFTTRRAS